MKKLSRFFTLILLALSMLLSVSCESGEKKEKTKFIYEIVDGYAVITGYSGIEDEVSVPSTIDGNTVKAVVVDNFAQARKWIDKLLADVEVQTGNKACCSPERPLRERLRYVLQSGECGSSCDRGWFR